MTTVRAQPQDKTTVVPVGSRHALVRAMGERTGEATWGEE